MFKKKPSRYVTVDEAAKILDVTKSRIFQLITARQFQKFVKRGRVYVLREEVEEYDEITQVV